MNTNDQTAVQMALTPVPELIPVVQGFVDRLAEQMSFSESQRVNLRQGIKQICGRIMEKGKGAGAQEMRLEFSGFPDRLEIVLEANGPALEASEADASRLNQLLDRVLFEEAKKGQKRVTLVKYHSQGGASREG